MNNRRLFLTLGMVALWCLFSTFGNPVFASGSFFDTIQGADESNTGNALPNEGMQQVDEQVAPASPEPAPAAQEDPLIKFAQSLSGNQYKIIFGNIITQILNTAKKVNLGNKIITIFLPKATGTIRIATGTIKIGTGTVTIPHGNASGTVTPPNPPASGTVQPPYNPPTASGTAGLRAEMIRRFGITPEDGESAWTDDQLTTALKALDKLPAGFRGCTTKIRRDKIFNNNPRTLGYVRMGIPTVYLLDGVKNNMTLFERTLVHELTHCFQAKNPSLGNTWKSLFWSNGQPVPPSVTSYGNTQPLEDMAESMAVYYTQPATMKATQPKRYEFIKQYLMGGKEF